MNLSEWHTLTTSTVFKAIHGGSKPVFTITGVLGYTYFFDSIETTPNLIYLYIEGTPNGSILHSEKGIIINWASNSDMIWDGAIFTGNF